MTEATRVDRLRLSKFERNIDLDLMARAAHQLKDGGSHGPYLSGYTVKARVLALMSVAAAGVGVVDYVGPEPGVWLTVAGLVVILAAPIFTYAVVMNLTKQQRKRLPSWSQYVDSELASYAPLNDEAWVELKSQIMKDGGVEAKRLLEWIKVERESVKAMPEDDAEAVHRSFISLPSIASSGK